MKLGHHVATVRFCIGKIIHVTSTNDELAILIEIELKREREGGKRREKKMGRKPLVKNGPNFAAVAQCSVVSTSGPRPSVTNLLKTAMSISTTSRTAPSTY